MRLRDLSDAEVLERLTRGRMCLRTGPFVLSIRTPIPSLANAITTLYADFPVEGGAFSDFHIDVTPANGWRRFTGPWAVITIGGYPSQDPIRRRLAPAFMEWALNYAISRSAHQYLQLHGAVVERDGQATVLLGRSGAGKSTLCTALVLAGWRLLSDEMTLIVPPAATVVGMARPISLKNESIDIVRTLAPDARFGPSMATTHKGLISHLRPPTSSVDRVDESAQLSRFIFVQYEAGASTRFAPVTPADAFARLVRQSFNYGIRARLGFDHLAWLVENCPTFSLTHGNVLEAVESIARDDFPHAA